MEKPLSQAEKEAKFYEAAGRAISAFGAMEVLLCNHFALITQLQPYMAKAVFFSARSLQGRLGMLDSALAAAGSANEIPSLIPFLKTASKRTGQWSSTRNKLAHSTVSYIDWDASKYHGNYILWDGASNDWPNPKSALTIEDIEIARFNFGRLATLLLAGYNETNPPNETTLKECHELVQLLPTQACEAEKRKRIQVRFERLLPDGSYQAKV
jgi:hypothetical protein